MIALFRTSAAEKSPALGAVGMDGDGIPVPLSQDETLKSDSGLAAFLQNAAQQSKTGRPLLALDEELAARLNIERIDSQPFLIDLQPESLAALLRQLNVAQLQDALRTGGPIEARHQGKRHLLIPAGIVTDADVQDSLMRMGSLKELGAITPAKSAEPLAAPRPAPTASSFTGVATNVPAERLTAAATVQWALRAQAARAAFAPVQIVMGRPSKGEGVLTWRNHRNLQFLTHRLRCHLRAEWSAHGETRPVEDVLRDLQEVHRATLTVNGTVMRRLATRPSKAVASTMDRLELWTLFESSDCGKK